MNLQHRLLSRPIRIASGSTGHQTHHVSFVSLQFLRSLEDFAALSTYKPDLFGCQFFHLTTKYSNIHSGTWYQMENQSSKMPLSAQLHILSCLAHWHRRFWSGFSQTTFDFPGAFSVHSDLICFRVARPVTCEVFYPISTRGSIVTITLLTSQAHPGWSRISLLLGIFALIISTNYI